MASQRELCGQDCRLGRSWPALALMMLVGCSEAPGPTETVDLGSLRTYADLSVASLVDGSGRLPSAELNRVARQQADHGRLLSERRAREFAQLAVHQFGPMLQGYLERGHGGPIDIAGLRVCGRSFFVEGPFLPLPEEIAVPAKKQFGSWWVVGLCGPGGVTQVSIAVSVYAGDLRVENGELRFPRVFGNEFKLVGVPRSWDGAIPISPERAIVMAGRHSGRKVAAVPSLVGPDLRRAYPQAAAWRLALGTERAPTERARDDGDVLYVGVGGALVGMPGVDEPARLMAPARSAAVAERVPLPTTAALLRDRPTADALVALVPRQDIPLHFASVGGN